MNSFEQTPCEKCFGGHYDKPIYSDNVLTGVLKEGLVYICDKCGHKKVTPTKADINQYE